ncbi:MAG: mechanosensitive ion channel family protein [Haloarculaceae archaeon]
MEVLLTAAPVADVGAVGLGSLASQLSTTDQRLLASAVVVAAALLVDLVVAPLLARQVRALVAREYLGSRLPAVAGSVNERFPVTTPLALGVRLLQLSFVVGTVLALLSIWNQLDTALTAVSYVEVTPVDVVKGLFTLLVLLAAYVGMGLLSDLVASLGDETERLTAHQQQIATRLGQLAILASAGLVAMGVWGVTPGGLLVGAGFLGIVVGFAARQTLGALIAGFILMFSRPFEVGDWVEIGDQQGIVTDITIVNTRLENFDGEFVIMPNDQVANQAITNRSQKGRLRLRIDVGVDYAADPERAAAVAEDALEGAESIESTPAPHVFPREFGDSAIVLELRCWIEDPTPPKRWRAQAAAIRRVKAAFDREGIAIPYPQRELSTRSVDVSPSRPDRDGAVSEADGDGDLDAAADGDAVADGDSDAAADGRGDEAG